MAAAKAVAFVAGRWGYSRFFSYFGFQLNDLRKLCDGLGKRNYMMFILLRKIQYDQVVVST
jgi:hypothetical protein